MDQEAGGWRNPSDTSLLTTFYALGSRDLEKNGLHLSFVGFFCLMKETNQFTKKQALINCKL